MHFQDEMIHLFFLQKEALRREGVQVFLTTAFLVLIVALFVYQIQRLFITSTRDY